MYELLGLLVVYSNFCCIMYHRFRDTWRCNAENDIFRSFQEWANAMALRPSSVRPSVCLSVCKLLRKSLLLAGKWPDRYQTFTRWTPGQRASRVCSRSRSRSKVTWYAHFLGFSEWATPSLTVWFAYPTCISFWIWRSCRWNVETKFGARKPESWG